MAEIAVPWCYEPGDESEPDSTSSGATAKGNRWLRATLGDAAWAASRTKHTYLSARYRRLVARRGRNRAIVAIGYQILTIVYFIIKHQVTYDDLGEDFYDRQRVDRLKHHHVHRLQRLGFSVEITEMRAAA